MKTILIYTPCRVYSPDFLKQAAADSGTRIGRIRSSMARLAEYRANARTLDYCLHSALQCPDLQDTGRPIPVHCLLDADAPTPEEIPGIQIQCHESFDAFLNAIEMAQPERIVALYSDAIGQGYQHVERVLFSRYRSRLFVLNGRRRFFALDRKKLRQLGIRRFIERTFLFEFTFLATLPLSASLYYLYERMTRPLADRTHRRRSGNNSRKAPTQIRSTGSDHSDEIIKYWASRPQTYGLEDGIPEFLDENGQRVRLELGDRAFFERVDETCYAWNQPHHLTVDNKLVPFGRIFPYQDYRQKMVLEIGCGMGTMAMNWASHEARLHAVDLNPVSVEQTRRRFELLGYSGDIRQADARALPFADDTFDYVYSWGVLHHSPDIARSLEEVYRVLRPGGKTGIMLYNRSSLLFRYLVQYQEGFLHMENKFLNLVQLASRYGDGYREEGNPHTYPVTRREVVHELMPQFDNLQIRIFGTDAPWLLSMMTLDFNHKVPARIVDSVANRLGWSMWITAQKS